MSNRNYIKGMRRRAAKRGLGRSLGNVAALAVVLDTEREKELARLRKLHENQSEAALAKLVARDQKRLNRRQGRGQ